MELVVMGKVPLKNERMILPDKLSYSQTATYIECGEKYRIERLHGMGNTGTWLATIGGSVIHELTEELDRAEFNGEGSWPLSLDSAHDMFKARLDDLLAEADASGVEVKVTGKVLKELSLQGGPNKKDYGWWLHYGPRFLLAWGRWRYEHPELRIANIGGVPGIELPFVVAFKDTDTGEYVELRGSIDRVMMDEYGNHQVLDIKTGNKPASDIQLVSYYAGLAAAYHVTATSGVYWFPRPETKDKTTTMDETSGHATYPVAFNEWDMERLGNMYLSARRGITSKVFLPHVTNSCRMCDVNELCWAVNGDKYRSLPAVSKFDYEG